MSKLGGVWPYILIIFVALGSAWSAWGAVMSSPSYKVQTDSLNIGGDTENSASYRLRDTAGELSNDVSSSASYKIMAGYRPMQEVYLALSAPGSVSLTPAIGGLTGGTGNGSAAFTVTTDNAAGYTLAVKASTAPALQSGANSFTDYTPAVGGTPDFDWAVGAAAAEFGFTPEGNHIPAKYKDNGTNACNAGGNDTADRCWYNLGLVDETIALNGSANHPTGTQTMLKLKAESGASNYQPAGNYSATLTVTAIAP